MILIYGFEYNILSEIIVEYAICSHKNSISLFVSDKNILVEFHYVIFNAVFPRTFSLLSFTLVRVKRSALSVQLCDEYFV